MSKNVAVVCGEKVHDVVVLPGSTSQDILNELGLGDFLLSPPNGQPFGDNEVLYDQIKDGAKLHATPEANVAN